MSASLDRDEVLYDWLEEPDTAPRSLHVYRPQGAAYFMAEVKRRGALVEWCAGESPRIAVEGLADLVWRRDNPEIA